MRPPTFNNKKNPCLHGKVAVYSVSVLGSFFLWRVGPVTLHRDGEHGVCVCVCEPRAFAADVIATAETQRPESVDLLR
jgi:hypothetical protein